jgi:flagellar hook assembly protein FlgD
LIIYNIRGEVVNRLVSGRYSAGRYQVEWDGLNEHGLKVASSIYIYRMQAGSYIKSRKMIYSK